MGRPPAPSDSAKFRNFASLMAKIESDARLTPFHVFTNGQAPFEELATRLYKVPIDQLTPVIQKILSDKSIRPNILVNGIPADGHLALQVSYNGG